MPDLVVEKQRTLGDELAVRGHALQDQAFTFDQCGGNFDRCSLQCLVNLGAERALFLGAARLPVAERNTRGARRGSERERPPIWTERVS